MGKNKKRVPPPKENRGDWQEPEAEEKSSSEESELRLDADPIRYARLLRLMRFQNPKNKPFDNLLRTGFIVYAGFSLFSLLFWGFVFMNRTTVMNVWLVSTLVVGIPTLLAEYIRMATGAASWLHRFRSPVLTLRQDRLIFETSCRSIGRKVTGRFRWVMHYRDVHRMEYDRVAKTLRIFGKFDSTECRIPGSRQLPEGMRRKSSEQDTESALRKQAVDVPMVFPRPDALLPALQERTGCYIHPAIRGDDLVDLRDLPGQKKEHSRVRPIGAALVAVTLCTFIMILWIRGYYQKNPFSPFPKTELQYLEQTFSIGETVVLDGCEITLRDITRVGKNSGGEVCYSLLITWLNENSTPVIVRAGKPYRDSESNIVLLAGGSDGALTPVPLSNPPLGFAGLPQEMPPRLESGKSVNVNIFFYMPKDATEIILKINSDYWPPQAVFRDVHYTGGEVVLRGQAVKDNEIRFRLPREMFE